MNKLARRQLSRVASRHPHHLVALRGSIRLDGSLDLNRLIRIASHNPELQPYLLPILREAANQPGRQKGKAEAPYIVWTMDATDKKGNGGAILQKRPGVRGARKSIPAKWYIPLSDFKKKLQKVTDRKKRSALNVAQKSGIKAVRSLYKAWLKENWETPLADPSEADEDAFRLKTVNRVLDQMSTLKPSNRPTKRDIKRVQRLQQWLETGSQRREEAAEQAEMEVERLSGDRDRKRERAEEYRKSDRYKERAKGTQWEIKEERATLKRDRDKEKSVEDTIELAMIQTAPVPATGETVEGRAMLGAIKALQKGDRVEVITLKRDGLSSTKRKLDVDSSPAKVYGGEIAVYFSNKPQGKARNRISSRIYLQYNVKLERTSMFYSSKAMRVIGLRVLSKLVPPQKRDIERMMAGEFREDDEPRREVGQVQVQEQGRKEEPAKYTRAEETEPELEEMEQEEAGPTVLPVDGVSVKDTFGGYHMRLPGEVKVESIDGVIYLEMNGKIAQVKPSDLIMVDGEYYIENTDTRARKYEKGSAFWSEARGEDPKIDPSKPEYWKDLSFESIVKSLSHATMRPEELAETLINGYQENLEIAHKKMSKAADGDKSLVEEPFSQYRATLKSKLLSYISAKSQVLSPMMAGRSNFNYKSNDKRMKTEGKRRDEYVDWGKSGLNESISEVRRSIEPEEDDETREEAIARLEEKLKRRKQQNKIIRSKKISPEMKAEKLMGLGLSERDAKFHTGQLPGWEDLGISTLSTSGISQALKEFANEIVEEKIEASAEQWLTRESYLETPGIRVTEDFNKHRLTINLDNRPATREGKKRPFEYMMRMWGLPIEGTEGKTWNLYFKEKAYSKLSRMFGVSIDDLIREGDGAERPEEEEVEEEEQEDGWWLA